MTDDLKTFLADTITRATAIQAQMFPPAPPASSILVFGHAVPTTQTNAPSTYPNLRKDRTVLVPGPLPTMPSAGGRYVDQAFNRPVLRVTDPSLANGKGWGVSTSEVSAAFSRDSSAFFIFPTNGQPVWFDVNGGHPIMRSTLNFGNEPTFSRVTPGVVYGGLGLKIKEYNTSVYKTLVDVALLDPMFATPDTYLGGSVQSSASDPERILFFYGGTGQDRHRRMGVFERQNPSRVLVLDTIDRTINGVPVAMDKPVLIHAGAIDQSGRYALVFSTSPDIVAGAAQIYVWDLETGTITAVRKNPAGHVAVGYGEMVNQDADGLPIYDAFQYRHRWLHEVDILNTLIQPPLGPLQYGADHPTWANARYDVETPFFTATYRFGFGDTTPWRATDNELLGVGLDGTLLRVAHHRSNVIGDGVQAQQFRYQPMTQVSPDGRWLLDMSNMEKSLGTEPGATGVDAHRMDVFLHDLFA